MLLSKPLMRQGAHVGTGVEHRKHRRCFTCWVADRYERPGNSSNNVITRSNLVHRSHRFTSSFQCLGERSAGTSCRFAFGSPRLVRSGLHLVHGTSGLVRGRLPHGTRLRNLGAFRQLHIGIMFAPALLTVIASANPHPTRAVLFSHLRLVFIRRLKRPTTLFAFSGVDRSHLRDRRAQSLDFFCHLLHRGLLRRDDFVNSRPVALS